MKCKPWVPAVPLIWHDHKQVTAHSYREWRRWLTYATNAQRKPSPGPWFPKTVKPRKGKEILKKQSVAHADCSKSGPLLSANAGEGHAREQVACFPRAQAAAVLRMRAALRGTDVNLPLTPASFRARGPQMVRGLSLFSGPASSPSRITTPGGWWVPLLCHPPTAGKQHSTQHALTRGSVKGLCFT